MGEHVRAMLEFQKRGSVVFDYGNNIRGRGAEGRGPDAFDFPGFVPAYIRPLFCEGKGPFRWAVLSGDPRDLAVTDDAVLETFPDDPALRRWITPGSREGARRRGSRRVSAGWATASGRRWVGCSTSSCARAG